MSQGCNIIYMSCHLQVTQKRVRGFVPERTLENSFVLMYLHGVHLKLIIEANHKRPASPHPQLNGSINPVSEILIKKFPERTQSNLGTC